MLLLAGGQGADPPEAFRHSAKPSRPGTHRSAPKGWPRPFLNSSPGPEQHPVDHLPVIRPLPARPAVAGQKRFDPLPLCVRELCRRTRRASCPATREIHQPTKSHQKRPSQLDSTGSDHAGGPPSARPRMPRAATDLGTSHLPRGRRSKRHFRMPLWRGLQTKQQPPRRSPALISTRGYRRGRLPVRPGRLQGHARRRR